MNIRACLGQDDGQHAVLEAVAEEDVLMTYRC